MDNFDMTDESERHGHYPPPPPINEEVIHIYHHFPDPIEVELVVKIESVPTSLGLIPGVPTSQKEK